jgi:haloacetate dehalogenase
LALWSATGPLATQYIDDGGPLALWRRFADDVAGRPVDGGHFFPEEDPARTAAALADFVSR